MGKPMADELVTCSACGTKNASQRTVCLSCGGDLSATKDGTETASQPLMKWVHSLAGNLNAPTKWSIAALFVVGVYFGLTWFSFGSSHPCGILEARQKPYVVERYTEGAVATTELSRIAERETFRAYEEAIRSGDPVKDAAAGASFNASLKQVERAMQHLSDAPKNAVHDLHEKIWYHYTPAQCLSEALAWNPDPYKGSPPLKDLLKAGE